jgi:PAS domain-containing protein
MSGIAVHGRSRSGPGTRFASRGRLEGDALAADLARAAASPIVDALLRSLGTAVFVLNEHRQILAANTASLQMLGLHEQDGLLGLRPGEAVHCVRAQDEEGGCGTSQACATCGAVIALLLARRHDRPEERNCAITIHSGTGTVDIDLRVRAVPLRIDGHDLMLVALSDIGQQSRHEAMERAFLHDIANLLTGLVAAADAIGSPDAAEVAEATTDVSSRTGWCGRSASSACSRATCSRTTSNPGTIPAAVVPRIFQRHFTTKSGPGRGEGTWSVKSLGERLLHGTVGFETDRIAGTTFWFRLPAAPTGPAS